MASQTTCRRLEVSAAQFTLPHPLTDYYCRSMWRKLFECRDLRGQDEILARLDICDIPSYMSGVMSDNAAEIADHLVHNWDPQSLHLFGQGGGDGILASVITHGSDITPRRIVLGHFLWQLRTTLARADSYVKSERETHRDLDFCDALVSFVKTSTWRAQVHEISKGLTRGVDRVVQTATRVCKIAKIQNVSTACVQHMLDNEAHQPCALTFDSRQATKNGSISTTPIAISSALRAAVSASSGLAQTSTEISATDDWYGAVVVHTTDFKSLEGEATEQEMEAEEGWVTVDAEQDD